MGTTTQTHVDRCQRSPSRRRAHAIQPIQCEDLIRRIRRDTWSSRTFATRACVKQTKHLHGDDFGCRGNTRERLPAVGDLLAGNNPGDVGAMITQIGTRLCRTRSNTLGDSAGAE